MALRLYRVTVPCRMLILAHSEDAAKAFGVEDFDAQGLSMQEEDVSSVQLSQMSDLSKEEQGKTPFYADDVLEKEKILRVASGWMAIIVAEEEEERRKQEEFNKRQLKLPGVE